MTSLDEEVLAAIVKECLLVSLHGNLSRILDMPQSNIYRSRESYKYLLRHGQRSSFSVAIDNRCCNPRRG